MLEFNQIWMAFLLAITAYVFSSILIEDDMLLSKYQKILNRLPDWLANPFGACDLCFGGQLALGIYIIEYKYDFLEHILFVSMTIFFIKLINTLITKWEN